TPVVAQAQEYEDVLSVQIVVQVDVPAGARWIVTEVTPTPSLAVAATVTEPRSGEPGSVSARVGPRLSTRRFVTVVDVRVPPATSVAMTRRSYRASVSVVV